MTSNTEIDDLVRKLSDGTPGAMHAARKIANRSKTPEQDLSILLKRKIKGYRLWTFFSHVCHEDVNRAINKLRDRRLNLDLAIDFCYKNKGKL